MLFHELVHACCKKLGLNSDELTAKILEVLCFGFSKTFPVFSKTTMCRICFEYFRYPKTGFLDWFRSELFAWNMADGHVVIIEDGDSWSPNPTLEKYVYFGTNGQDPKNPYGFVADSSTGWDCGNREDWLAWDGVDLTKCPKW
jgi:hypothetical protein